MYLINHNQLTRAHRMLELPFAYSMIATVKLEIRNVNKNSLEYWVIRVSVAYFSRKLTNKKWRFQQSFEQKEGGEAQPMYQ